MVFVSTFVTKVTEYLCSGWVFFFKQVSFFYLAIFDGSHCSLKLVLKKFLACDHFLQSYWGLKIAILANLGQLTRDIFRTTNALAEN